MQFQILQQLFMKAITLLTKATLHSRVNTPPFTRIRAVNQCQDLVVSERAIKPLAVSNKHADL